ncbi:putative lipid-binding transport protein (Tim44 family) [Acinetobacter calcoaceticus]|uniref:Putative lipid-binding transport protein (Tim44 family) n=1 Tax=Acinetobacter calcoaceticus TaxID=471 RepID=A0A4V2R152_ACICA|nr:putative lipid-binding transport protein (Tim44 family) [Acinetobacter calcoaceticus]
MEVRQRGLMAGVLMAALAVAPLAEAKRAGGGKSHGMSRSNASSQTSQQARPATPPPTQQPTAPQRSGPGVGTMVAAGVAGAAVGAVAANAMADDRPASTETNPNATDANATQQQQVAQQEQEKGGIPPWLWLVLIAGGAFLLFRKFGAKKKLANANPYAPNSAGPTAAPFAQNQTSARTQGDNTNIFGQSLQGGAANVAAGGAYSQSGQQLPDGTEPAAFLRVARQRFNHIQSMNTATNIEEIRRYLTADLYQSMYNDIMANQDQDVAEFSNLNAMVSDSATENGQYVVSVRFTGTVSEDLNSLPQPFAEVWHFVKPAGSTQDWVVAGIQQN